MKAITRQASAHWKSGARRGTRGLIIQSRYKRQNVWVPALRGERRMETYPAQLLATAHANSYSLALSCELNLRPFTRGEIVTATTVSLEFLNEIWTIMSVHLDVLAKLPTVTQGEFIDASIRAKTSCQISRLLQVNISMNAKLEN